MATSMGQELEIFDPNGRAADMQLWRAPETVLAEAHSAAQSLQKILAGKKKKVVFNGEEYLEMEDWETLGHFYGYAAKIESTSFVQFGEAQGFEAAALLLNERTGLVVGRAEAMCLNDEENWGMRPVYEWRNRERVQVGEKPTPLSQIRSMAQSRACCKAFRHKLAWVAVLAGYKPTPAEEVSEDTLPQEPAKLPTEISRKAPAAQVDRRETYGGYPLGGHEAAAVVYAPPPRPAPQPARPVVQSPKPSAAKVITEGQSRRFYAIWKNAGKTKEQVSAYLREVIGVERDLDIPASRYEEACIFAEGSDF